MVDDALRDTLDRALLALGRLDGVTAVLPHTRLFLYMYVRKETVLSSQIEGTQSSLSDFLLFELKEAPGVPLVDVAEVSNYVAALEHGLSRCKEGFPLSNRLIREIHAVPLREAGEAKNRGPGDEPGGILLRFSRGRATTSEQWVTDTFPVLPPCFQERTVNRPFEV